METLFVLIVSSIAAALFASQNTQTTSISFANYTFTGIPVYLISLCGVLVGIFISLIVSFLKSFVMIVSSRGKEVSLNDLKKENIELTKEVHKLELENTRLKTRLGEQEDDNSM